MDSLMMSLQKAIPSPAMDSSTSSPSFDTSSFESPYSSYPFEESNGSVSLDPAFSSSPSTEMIFTHDFYANWTQEMKDEVLSQLRRAMFALTSRAKVEIYIYSFLFIISVVGNLSAVSNLLKRENRRKRMNRLVIHLSIADLMVTFITIPFELGWRFTVTWKAGNIGCKVFQFLRVFGLYLSSMVLVCISIDRYYAIVHPLRVNYVNQRNRRLLSTAYAVSIFFSIPEAVVYSVKQHPLIPDFVQCVSFNFFPNQWMEKGYNFFCLFGLYFGPLLVIIVCYSQILRTIFTQPVINDVLQTRESEVVPKRRTRRWLLRIRENKRQRQRDKKKTKIEEDETELDVLKSKIHEENGKQRVEELNARGKNDLSVSGYEVGKDDHHGGRSLGGKDRQRSKKQKVKDHNEVEDGMKTLQHQEHEQELVAEAGRQDKEGTCQVVIEPREPEAQEGDRTVTLHASHTVIIVTDESRLKLAVNKKSNGQSNNTVINEDSSKLATNRPTSPCSSSRQVTPAINHNKSNNGTKNNNSLGTKSTKTTISSYVCLSNKIRRAKRRTVRMSIVIIAAFLICWTPYVVVVFWYQIDEESAKRFDEYTKDGLFTFAVANSCLNPLVYGSHLIRSACQGSTNRLTNVPVASRATKRSIVDSTGNTV